MSTAQDSTRPWPDDTSLAAFKRAVAVDECSVYAHFHTMNRTRIKVQKPDLAIPRIKTILEATFRICEDRGFHAMSLRDLCEDTGLSMGGMYNYIRSKEDLSAMITDFVGGFFVDAVQPLLAPKPQIQARLESGIRTQVYMSEIFRPWYFFVYMETKNLPEAQIKRAKQMERRSLREIQALIEQGVSEKLYGSTASYLTASAIVSLIQDWHVKSWHFRGRKISAQRYANFVIDMSNRMLS